MKWIFFLVFSFIGLTGFNQNPIFDAGNSFYANGSYADALNEYNKLVGEDQLSASLYYNIGNTYFKLNELGECIWAYEKALKINPGDKDILYNLDFAKQQTFDKIEGEESSIGNWLKMNLFSFSINMWSILSVLFSFLLAFGIVLFFTRKKHKNIGLTIGFASLLFLFVCIILAHLHKSQILEQNYAVVITEVIEVKTSPSDTAPKSFELHEGTKVSLLRTNENWIEITINGNTGWIDRESIWKI